MIFNIQASRSKRFRTASAMLIVMLATAISVLPNTASDPMSSFSWLVGSKWKAKDGAYHEFAWGLGRKSVIAKSYFISDGEPKLVSEGIWFWHPAEQSIKGYFMAKNMPFVFMEFTTRFENGTMINKLEAFAKDGKVSKYTSTWTPTDTKTGYHWKLFTGKGETLKEVMNGHYNKE